MQSKIYTQQHYQNYQNQQQENNQSQEITEIEVSKSPKQVQKVKTKEEQQLIHSDVSLFLSSLNSVLLQEKIEKLNLNEQEQENNDEFSFEKEEEQLVQNVQKQKQQIEVDEQAFYNDTDFTFQLENQLQEPKQKEIELIKPKPNQQQLKLENNEEAQEEQLVQKVQKQNQQIEVDEQAFYNETDFTFQLENQLQQPNLKENEIEPLQEKPNQSLIENNQKEENNLFKMSKLKPKIFVSKPPKNPFLQKPQKFKITNNQVLQKPQEVIPNNQVLLQFPSQIQQLNNNTQSQQVQQPQQEQNEGQQPNLEEFLVEDNLNISQQQYIKQQMEMMKQFEKQVEKQNQYKKKQMGYFNFKDDDPIAKFNYQNFELSKNNVKYSLQNKLQFTMRPLKEIIKANLSKSQVVPFVCSLQAADVMIPDNIEQEKQQERAPIDVILVLDVSGSMAGSKLRLLKETVNFIIDTLSPKDRVSVIKFSHKAKRIVPLKRLTQQNQPKIFDTIENIKASGGTNIAAAMDVTLAALKQRRFKNPVTSVLLLSDGLDDGAQDRVKTLLQQYSIQSSFTLNTFGYGKDHDADLMDGIASLKDGTFYVIDKIDSVSDCFADCVGGLISVIAKDGVISVLAQNPDQLPKGSVKIKKAFGGEDLWSHNEQLGVFNTKITHLYSGTKRDFVLELELGPTKPLQDFQKSMSLARAKCTIIGVDGQKFEQEQQLKITLLNHNEKSDMSNESKEVALQYYRVEVAEVMKIAQNLAKANNYKEATLVLQTMKSEILYSKFKGEVLLQALLEDLDQAIKNVQPQRYQTIGNSYLSQSIRGHMEQRSNPFTSQMTYQNYSQTQCIRRSKTYFSSKK